MSELITDVTFGFIFGAIGGFIVGLSWVAAVLITQLKEANDE